MSLQLVEENLVRQNKALLLLLTLLEEEFSRLQKGEPQRVAQIELSIQELMRQIASERLSLRRHVDKVVPGAQMVAHTFAAISGEERTTLEKLLAMMDESEQRCARQASKNGTMAKALFDQSNKLLTFMHNQIKPKNTNAYAASGKFAQARSDARLLNGRL
ncbi:flagellar export chaperone FlgN [Pseudodesulfovibrio sp.]|uniref:flagellar export chaperone FlgN n=1 Tax=unclassified Pseudodesulfovibrio TaxID=2661612 RepID=UPI003AFFCA35